MELVFVLDCSGSMAGEPLLKAKRAVRRVLRRLSPDDTFQIIRFSSRASALGPAPIVASPKNIKRGLRYLDSLNATGGTMMIEGIVAALDFPHANSRLRLVSFMTDGYIGNETEILAAIVDKLGAARIFSFGVGSSVNRYLLERMAKLGRGAVAYVGLNDAASDRAVDDFYKRISHPALTDVTVQFGGMAVSDIYPVKIPDLFVGRPVVITGKFKGKPAANVTAVGRARGQRTSYAVTVNTTRNHPALAKVWARSKIEDLVNRAIHVHDIRPFTTAIKQTALHHGMLSAYTAFVAVDSSRKTAGDHGTTVPVPVGMPRGVRYDTTVAGP